MARRAAASSSLSAGAFPSSGRFASFSLSRRFSRAALCLAEASPKFSRVPCGMKTHGPGATPSPATEPRSVSSVRPSSDEDAKSPEKLTPPSAKNGASDDPAPRIPRLPPAARTMRPRLPAERLRAQTTSFPAACGTGSKSMMPEEAHCFTTSRSQSTSASANAARRSARDTTSPVTVHSHRRSAAPAAMDTERPEATPTEAPACPRCAIAARAASANAVAAAAAAARRSERLVSCAFDA